MDSKRIQQFRENEYREETVMFLSKTQSYLAENRIEIAKKVQQQLEEFMRAIARGQEEVPIPVGSIQISLLEISIYLDKPMLRMDAYDNMGIFGRLLFSKHFPCEWILTYWDEYRMNLLKRIEKMNAVRFISEETVRVMMQETFEYLRAYLIGVIKYPFAYADLFEGIQGVMKEEEFMISVGSYLDKQKALYMERRETDIIFNPEGIQTDFCLFKQKIYKTKTFEKLNLKHSRFVECQFVNSSFKNVDLSDAIFDNCRFYRTDIEECNAYGLTMINCIFDTVTIKETPFHYKGEKDGSVRDIYKPLDILESQIKRVTIINCDLEYARGSDNEVIQLELQGCLTANSIFEEKEKDGEES